MQQAGPERHIRDAGILYYFDLGQHYRILSKHVLPLSGVQWNLESPVEIQGDALESCQINSASFALAQPCKDASGDIIAMSTPKVNTARHILTY